MNAAVKIEDGRIRIPRVRRGVRTVRVALAGCGTVGGELVRILHHAADDIRLRHGLRFELTRVLVAHRARPRPGELDTSLLTTDVDAFLTDAAEADVVVEAVGGIDPALRIATAALRGGKRLVTANKALVAAHGPRLVALARKHGGRLDFESAAAGGIPIVRALREPLSLTGITRVRGILNGTTNYILSRVEDGWTFPAALADAQARGFAEADPSRDLSGEDAADKLRNPGVAGVRRGARAAADPPPRPGRRRGPAGAHRPRAGRRRAHRRRGGADGGGRGGQRGAGAGGRRE
jgi:homoserine dehydrogenase